MFWIVALPVLFVLLSWLCLRGENLSTYDAPTGQHFDSGPEPSDEHDTVVASIAIGSQSMQQGTRRQRLSRMRDYFDNMSEGMDLDASFTGVDAGGVPAEWVLAPGADPARRLLYIHGGAFMMGSPRSHRNITSRFSVVARAAVLAIDYRLMPENSRMAGIRDCRTAYEWILQHGPTGTAPAQKVFVAGDSAGGNLTLSLLAWARDQQQRQPDAAVALSPATDTTLSSPSLRHNLATDPMLAPMFRGLNRVPRVLLWWLVLLQNRMRPGNPVLSPVFGDLAGLPPTLVHASEAELLIDDARRYVNRAVAAGSPAQLQSWSHMVHVWHMFYPQLTEARHAWDEIEQFFAQLDKSAAPNEAAA